MIIIFFNIYKIIKQLTLQQHPSLMVEIINKKYKNCTFIFMINIKDLAFSIKIYTF